MHKYRISKQARKDLIAIAHYGDWRYGIQASDAYRDKLIRRFEAFAEKPLRYPPVDHVCEGYRRW
jgi:plasmid stabilization system protein ParE